MAKSVNTTNLKWEELQTLHCFIHPSIFIITITIADRQQERLKVNVKGFISYQLRPCLPEADWPP